ncbi:carboxypeptidase-like regulatory domain-containing protein, partial [uncultured Bacteroides sp.]
MKSRFIIFLLSIIGLCGVANAQNIEIKGQVVDNQGLPLIMVNVIEVGTTNGTVTDMDGNYTISVPEGSVIEFSFIGFTSIKKTVSAGMSEINVTLLEDTQVLDDVVVTALGIKRQEKALSYNVQSVKQDELTRVKDANLINSLSGKIAGVNIQTSSSGVGGATKVVMRGVKSIEGSNNALYVIDGVPMFNSVGEEGSG